MPCGTTWVMCDSGIFSSAFGAGENKVVRNQAHGPKQLAAYSISITPIPPCQQKAYKATGHLTALQLSYKVKYQLIFIHFNMYCFTLKMWLILPTCII